MTLPQTIIAGLDTTAAKIRALAASGMTRADIARFLGIRYQHVRNTLVASASSGVAGVVQEQLAARAAPDVSSTLREVRSCRSADLLVAGFALVGEWAPCPKAGLRLSGAAPRTAGVYAFLVDDELSYIGVTQRDLQARLYGYTRGYEGQRTNARLKRLICACIDQGQRVVILVASPGNFMWNGLPVDGAAGLEYGLIRLYRPQWNQLGT